MSNRFLKIILQTVDLRKDGGKETASQSLFIEMSQLKASNNIDLFKKKSVFPFLTAHQCENSLKLPPAVLCRHCSHSVLFTYFQLPGETCTHLQLSSGHIVHPRVSYDTQLHHKNGFWLLRVALRLQTNTK